MPAVFAHKHPKLAILPNSFFFSQKTDLGFLGLAVWLAESSNIETKKNVKIMLQNQYATKIE